MNIIRFVINILTIGATLLCIGSLGEIVADLQKKAAHDTAIGIISIEKWNRSLTMGDENRDPSHLRGNSRK